MLMSPDLKFASPVVVFFCRHTFHEDCLPAHVAASSNLVVLIRLDSYFILKQISRLVL